MKPDLAQRMAAASRHVDVDWSDAHLDVQGTRLARRLRRRRRAKVAAVGGMAAALTAIAAVAWLRVPVAPPVAQAPGPRPVELPPLALPNGGTAALGPGARVRPTTDGAALEQGRAEFAVSVRAERPFRVLAGAVTVEVLGTAFSVERTANGARVAVSHGRVRVSWPDGEEILGPGARGEFPPARPAATGETTAAPQPSPAVREVPRRRPEAASQRLAQRRPDDPRPAPDAVAGLLAVADAARRQGRPRDAVEPLRAIMERHRGDARAPLAAFTLGRLLLEDVGDARAAAAAFAAVRALDRRTPLAADALAREVEAWDRANDRTRARAAGQEYLRRFPDGDRADLVRRQSGLSSE